MLNKKADLVEDDVGMPQLPLETIVQFQELEDWISNGGKPKMVCNKCQINQVS